MNQVNKNPVIVANCSGFYGDRLSAAKEMVEGGPIDYLTGDYLAELTMLILAKNQLKGRPGYARTFYTQMEQIIGTCKDKNIKVVSNAGGLDPERLSEDLSKLCDSLGISMSIGCVTGDDLRNQYEELRENGEEFQHLDTGIKLSKTTLMPISINAYLGAFPIVSALESGADIVITGRATDAAIVMAPAIWNFSWGKEDWDKLAGALVAGHVIECGAQATGGNYAFFDEINNMINPGFPIAEIYEDGSSVITKHPNTAGTVNIGTVTSQLLYEISDRKYYNPDVIALFDSIKLDEIGPDRVKISGTKGLCAPKDYKVSTNIIGGYKNKVDFMLTGLNIEKKANLIIESFKTQYKDLDKIESFNARLIRSDKQNANTNEEATAVLRITVKSKDENLVGRRFSSFATELALASYPGFYLSAPPVDANAYGVFWPSLIDKSKVKIKVKVGSNEIYYDETGLFKEISEPPFEPYQTTHRFGSELISAPLGLVAGARSGDKGGNANVGFWTKNIMAYDWLYDYLTVEKFKDLLPEAKELDVRRFDFPNIYSLNFIVKGLLGLGVAESDRPDPQAKSLGEYLRSRIVEIPKELIKEVN
jgi:hypothetical protein